MWIVLSLIQHQTQQLLYGVCGREHESWTRAKQQQWSGDWLCGGCCQWAAHIHCQWQGAKYLLSGTWSEVSLGFCSCYREAHFLR